MVHSRFSTNTFPELGPGSAQPLHEPQRRDQYPAGERQLDDRAPGRRAHRAVRRFHHGVVPGGGTGLLRFRSLRQRSGVSAHDRANPPGVGHDDDPGGVAEKYADARDQAGVLRVPVLRDGTLGRASVHRVHRRPLHRARSWTETACGPSRYYLTHDDRVIMASEVGVLEVDPAMVKFKGRLEPGRHVPHRLRVRAGWFPTRN